MPVSATGLNAVPTLYAPNTTISSSAANANNAALNGALNPTFQTLGVAGASTLDNGNLTTDGSGNLTAVSVSSTGGALDSSGFLHLGLGAIMEGFSFFTGTGSGTYNHGLGAVPKFVGAMAHAVGSQTMGWDSETSTTVHITCGASLAFAGMAIRYV